MDAEIFGEFFKSFNIINIDEQFSLMVNALAGALKIDVDLAWQLIVEYLNLSKEPSLIDT